MKGAKAHRGVVHADVRVGRNAGHVEAFGVVVVVVVVVVGHVEACKARVA